MFRKALPVVLFLLCLAAPSFAAEREQRSREPRMRDERVFARIVRVIKKVIGTGDGITIPIP